MKINQKLRIPLLAFTFSSVVLVLGKVIFLPITENSAATPFNFPEQVPLSEWKLKASDSLPKPTQENEELISQKRYQYIQKDLPLDIEMRYVKAVDVKSLIKNYTQISSAAVVRQQKGVGYYGVGVDKQRAYLSACINSQGGSTFTFSQFTENQAQQRSERFLPWLLGQQPIEDKRCLWAHLSVPLKDSSPEASYKILENTWFSWYQWWQPRFPKS